MPTRLAPSRPARTVAVVDAAALVVFACVGLLSHGHGLTAGGLARDGLPLLAGWFAVALALGAYRRPTRGRLVAAWAVGVPLGVLLRALVLGRELDGGQAAFLATTLAFTGLLLTAGRLLLGLASRGAHRAPLA